MKRTRLKKQLKSREKNCKKRFGFLANYVPKPIKKLEVVFKINF